MTKTRLFGSASPTGEPPITTAEKLKSRPRIAKLDGKAPPRPRGKHAKKADADEVAAPRETITIPVAQRLGFRPAEFAALIGVSEVTIWRGIKGGKIDIVDQGGIKIIPRKFAVKAGYLDAAEV